MDEPMREYRVRLTAAFGQGTLAWEAVVRGFNDEEAFRKAVQAYNDALNAAPEWRFDFADATIQAQ